MLSRDNNRQKTTAKNANGNFPFFKGMKKREDGK